MAHYVCSDIHGRMDRYQKLLDTIPLTKDDTLFVLGDVIDRNPDGIAILSDLLARENTELFLGNHEWFLYRSMAADGDTFTAGRSLRRIWCSRNNGGEPTARAFNALDADEKRRILDAIWNSTLLRIVEINGIRYHLSHSYTLRRLEKENYRFCEVPADEAEDVVWKSLFREGEYHVGLHKFDPAFHYIVGHVPVQRVSGDYHILRQQHITDIDGGCAYSFLEGSCLACLRLEDQEEFYIR